jgi:hypothetical protein
VLCCALQKEQSLGAAWASIGRGSDAKKLENITAPTNRLVSAECDENCGFNNRDVLNGTAMDAGLWGWEMRPSALNPHHGVQPLHSTQCSPSALRRGWTD